VTREDGSPAPYAAVIATHTNGRQEYEPTDENGVAVLYLLEGKHNLRCTHDGQRMESEVELDDEPVEKRVQLKDQRKLYIVFSVPEGGDNASISAYYSIIVDTIKSRYPNAVYLTYDEFDNTELYDGDSVMEIYTIIQSPLPTEFRASFYLYNEKITVRDLGKEEGKRIFVDSSLFTEGAGVSVIFGFDTGWDENRGTVLSKSYYEVNKWWTLPKYSKWADSSGCGYNSEYVLDTSIAWQDIAPGVGLKIVDFWLNSYSEFYHDYLMYAEQLFPYVDLWLSGNWNEGIENIAPVQ